MKQFDAEVILVTKLGNLESRPFALAGFVQILSAYFFKDNTLLIGMPKYLMCGYNFNL